MANMNLYSRGDKVFVRLNMVLITVFALSTHFILLSTSQPFHLVTDQRLQQAPSFGARLG